MIRRIVFLSALFLLAAGSAAAEEASTHFQTLCASCHGVERYGGEAPPLLPEALGRKTDDQLVEVILNGRPNTQMPPFSAVLSEADARALVALFRTPVAEVSWGVEQIAASRKTFVPDGPRLRPKVERENITLVVERGAGSIAVLDGDTLGELDRFVVGRIHGGPKFDQALSRVWAVTRDGNAVAYNLDKGGVTARAKVAVNGRNLAVSPDGKLVAVTAQLPAQVIVLDGALKPLAVLPLDGQPSGVYQVPGEDRFILTLRDKPSLLTIEHDGFAVTETVLPEPFEDFVFVPGRRQLLASSRAGGHISLYDLDQNKVVASLETEALPHLFSACFFEREGALHAALNHIGSPKLTVVAVDDLSVQAEVPLAGSGYFARTHPGTPWLWVDTNTETLTLVDKATLTELRELVPQAGRKAMHVEFTRDGSQALVSVWHADGAVVVYSSDELKETKRLPFNMPIGKYNAWNKTAHFR